MGSFILRLEELLAKAAAHDELVLVGLLDDAGVHELRHQVAGHLGGLQLVLQLPHARLEAVGLREPVRLLGELTLLLLLLGLDLSLGPSPLGADLQRYGADALADCEIAYTWVRR